LHSPLSVAIFLNRILAFSRLLAKGRRPRDTGLANLEACGAHGNCPCLQESRRATYILYYNIRFVN